MPIGVRFGLSLVLVLAGASASVSGQVVGLGLAGATESQAYSVSDSGRYAFGRAGSVFAPTPVRWLLTVNPPSPPTFEILEIPAGEHAIATVCSADGRAALLSGRYLWREGAGITRFAALPHWWGEYGSGAAMAPDGTVYGWASVVVGGKSVYRAARWVTPDAPEELPLPEGAASTFGTVTDGAGRVYFMAWFESGEYRMYRMTQDKIELLTSVERFPELHEVSHDGSTVGGARFTPSEIDFWAWNATEGFAPIMTSEPYTSSPTAIAPDGSVIFGYRYTEGGTRTTFAWSRGSGMVSADQYFVDLGIDLEGWSGLDIYDVSADGTKFVGSGINPQGAREGVLIIVDSCDADFNGDDAVNSQDFFDFIGCFFDSSCQRADFNGDKAINSQDFFDFLGAFFQGC